MENSLGWGQAPWTIDFNSDHNIPPDEVDFAIIGGGFTGLTAAAWLRYAEPKKSVALFESETIGAGSSGRTGGMVLAETAAGDLPGLGDVLKGFSQILRELRVTCGLTLPGAWELSRTGGPSDSIVSWTDSGNLRIAREVPGGTIDPGKLVSGLARVAVQRGALIFERASVESIACGKPLTLSISGKRIRAGRVLVATNAESLELGNLVGSAQPKFTLAIATGPLPEAQIRTLGLDSGNPFYTLDFPYLWGRLLGQNRIIFGSGLLDVKNWRELLTLDVARGEPADLLASLERRVKSLHPSLRELQISHRWGGPILIAEGWRPVFRRHTKDPRIIVLGAYSGHGVALSVYLGSWAAEALLGGRALPKWNAE